MRVFFSIIVVASALASTATATDLITNGKFDNGMSGWIQANSGWGEDPAQFVMSAGSSDDQWGPTDHTADPCGKNVVGWDPTGVHWIFQHLSNLTVGQSYTLSGKIAGGYGNTGPLEPGTELNWVLGYAEGAYDPSYLDMGVDTPGTNFVSAVRYDFPTDGVMHGFDWMSGSATFTATSTEYTVFFRYYANTAANYQAYASYVDDISLTTEGCAEATAFSAVKSGTTGNQIPAGQTANLTIIGSNLDAATSVYLSPASDPGVQITGTSFTKHGSAPDTYLTADFAVPSTLGPYNLTVISPPCSPGNGSRTLDAAVRAYSSGLVINGDFESGDLAGWAKWGGDSNNGISGADGPNNIFGHTAPYAGSYDYGVGESGVSGGPKGIYQQVTLPEGAAGDQYTLNWMWMINANTGVGNFEIGVVPGWVTDDFNNAIKDGGGNTIAVQNPAIARDWQIKTDGPDTGFEEGTLTFARPATTKVTVYVKAKGTGDGVNWALFLDNMSMVSAGTSCSAMEASTFQVTYAVHGYLGGTNLPANHLSTRDFIGLLHRYRITGQNLDQVTRATLQRSSSGDVVLLVIDSQSATEITAHTDAGPNGALSDAGVSYILPTPPGTYNLFLTSATSDCAKATIKETALRLNTVGGWGDGTRSMTGVRRYQDDTTVTPGLDGDSAVAAPEGSTTFDLEFFGNFGSNTVPDAYDLIPQGTQTLRAARLVNHRTGEPATDWFAFAHHYASTDADGSSARGGTQRISGTVNIAGLEVGYYDIEYVWNNEAPDKYTFQPNKNIYPNDDVPAFVIYGPGLSNTSFEVGEDGSSAGNACDTPRAGKPAPRDWDGAGGVLERDSTWSLPDCVDGTVPNIDGNHYASIVADLAGLSTMSMFQTIPAPSTTTAVVYRADVCLKSDDTQATGRIVLLDGTAQGTEIDASPEIGDTSLLASGGFVADEANKATVPQGYTFTSSPALLTIKFEATNPNASDHEPVGFHLDRVYTGAFAYPGCNPVRMDADNDGDVDQADFAILQACYGAASPLSDVCRCFDAAEPMGTITQADFAVFEDCASGPGITEIPVGCNP